MKGMRALRAAAWRLAGFFGIGRRDRDIDGELRAHREMLADEYQRTGMTPAAARQRAAADFGSLAVASEAYRDRRGLPRLEHLIRDCRMAVRSLVRTPLLTASMVLVLGLGIGIATAIAAVFNAVVWEALPVAQADRVVQLAQRFEGQVDRKVQGNRTRFSYPELQAYRQATQSFSALTGSTGADAAWRHEGTGGALHGEFVTAGFFDVFPAVPTLGRMLTAADAERAVVVIAHQLWTSAFASSPTAVGQTMNLDGSPFVIVGVAPAWLSSLQVDQPGANFWLPLEAWHAVRGDRARLAESNRSWLQVFGRLADATSLTSARQEAARVASGFDRDYPGRRTTIDVNRASRIDRTGFRSNLLTLGGVLFVFLGVLFLICGSNAAALLLARGASRQREIAVRLALGASRLQIVRQLGAEIFVIAAASALTGVAISIASLHALARRVPMRDVLLSIQPDASVFGFAFAVAFLVAAFFGLAPARQALAVDCLANLKGDVSFFGRALSGIRLRRALISIQVAVSLPLLVVAVLFGRAVTQAWRSDPGFDAKGLYVIEPNMTPLTASADFVERLRALPGVRAVGRTLVAPFFGQGSSHATPNAARPPESVRFNPIDEHYFTALGVPFVAGRGLATGESDAVVVNSQMARRFWGDDARAVGSTLFIPGPRTADGRLQPVRVVGVVPAVQTTTLGVPDEPTYYLRLDEERASFTWTLVRSEPNAAVQGLIAAEVRSTSSDPRARVLEVDTRLLDVTRPARIGSIVAGAIGLLALLVAAVGVHGVIAYTVANRTRDIGIYQALGARPTEVLRLVIGWTLGGVVAGVVGSAALLLLGATTFRRQLLPIFNGINPLDLPSFSVGLAVLAGVIGVAAYLPARRAVGMAPLAALRHE